MSNRIGRNVFEAIFSHRLLDCRHFLDVARCWSASVDWLRRDGAAIGRSDRLGDCHLSVERAGEDYLVRVAHCGALVYSGLHETLLVAVLVCERIALSWLCP